ncbi:MAG TPA: acyl-CoA dehydrogenase family protein, partial [Gammaproteobacteria bacterium]|nr:acyl-CoA dehydrogenase family protein [Gammaproteobacteria bacterium]
MDFRLGPEIEDYRRRIRSFVEAHIVPLESDPEACDEGDNIAPEALDRLREKARSEGLWCLQMPRSRGGQGLSMVGMAACYEEMNRSIFG